MEVLDDAILWFVTQDRVSTTRFNWIYFENILLKYYYLRQFESHLWSLGKSKRLAYEFSIEDMVCVVTSQTDLVLKALESHLIWPWNNEKSWNIFNLHEYIYSHKYFRVTFHLLRKNWLMVVNRRKLVFEKFWFRKLLLKRGLVNCMVLYPKPINPWSSAGKVQEASSNKGVSTLKGTIP